MFNNILGKTILMFNNTLGNFHISTLIWILIYQKVQIHHFFNEKPSKWKKVIDRYCVILIKMKDVLIRIYLQTSLASKHETAN